MIPASAVAEAHRREYRALGFLRETFALSAPALLPQLCRDVAEFDARLAEWRSLGHARIPYLFTAAIERVAHDPARLAHLGDFRLGLVLDAHCRVQETSARRSRVTSSTGLRPSISLSFPAAR